MTLEFTLNRGACADVATDCIVVGAFTDGTLTPAAQSLDGEGRLAALAARGDLSGATGRSALLHDLPGVASPRVLVVGLGERARFGVPQYLKAVADAVRALRTGPVKQALFTLSELEVDGRDAAWAIRQAGIAADHAAYRYLATLGAKNKKRGETGLAALAIQGDDAQALAQGKAIAAGVRFARELGNLPPNVCNPAYLAEQARDFAERFEGAEAEILDETQMEALGMGALLAVARGSANRPRLVVLKWNGGGDARPYVLVGKGITFDTGGVNLKTQGGIEEMKYDMLGAGAVLGTFVAAAGMDLAQLTAQPGQAGDLVVERHHPRSVVQRAGEAAGEQGLVRGLQRRHRRCLEQTAARAGFDQRRRRRVLQQLGMVEGSDQHASLQQELEVDQAAGALLEVETSVAAAVEFCAHPPTHPAGASPPRAPPPPPRPGARVTARRASAATAPPRTPCGPVPRSGA